MFALGSYNRLNNKNNCKVLVGVTLGTGFGVGIIINGTLFTGGFGLAGEYEVSPLLENKTWTDLVGYRFFNEITRRYFGKIHTPKEIYDFTNPNTNTYCRAMDIWKHYGINIGLCLSHIIGLINPNKIVIGGGISKAHIYFHEVITRTLGQKCLIYDSKKVEITYDKDNTNIYYGGLHL